MVYAFLAAMMLEMLTFLDVATTIWLSYCMQVNISETTERNW
jgi:hypothetical protein